MTPFATHFKNLLMIVAFFCVSKNTLQSQCVEIESILVAACGTPEGQNEMFRFRVGPSALNSGDMAINWPSNTWEGFVQNATTATKVATLNANIIADGGCGELLEPVGGVLPANAPVIVVTSYLFDTAANSFGALTEDTYILFQNSTATGGHFGNYQPTGTRTLSISFGPGCVDTVTYTRNLLSQTSGAAVNFTPSGAASYFNNGCSAPVEPFSVDAGPVSISSCPGAVLNFTGAAEGYQTVLWNATQGTFSSPTTLATTFTIPSNGTGTIAVTLTATNACGATIVDTITILVNSNTTPTFTINSVICNGQAAPVLPTTSTNGISGTWSPATVSNTTSGSYIFTPSASSCATPFTLNTTVVNGNIVPIFSAVNAICAGGTLNPLPTTSNNGINGTWSPALNNMSTTLYTFTPLAGQCATSTILSIPVSPNITPTFSPVGPFCAGATIPPLPTTSNNNIQGSWSPALNNTATTTYTFSPNVGYCASNTTLTITVTPSTTPTFSPINPICQGATLAPLPTTSTNGISGSWSPALNNNTTTTYTFIPNSSSCAFPTTLTIIVNPSITPTFSPVAAICPGETLAALPTTSLNGINGSWAPALNNTATTTYTFTPTAGQCATTQTLTIAVLPNTTPTFAAVNPICAGETLAALPTNSTNGITGTWSPTLDNTTTTTYTFTPDGGQCAGTTTLNITVTPSITPTFTAVDPICAGETLTPLPTISNNSISGSWSPALNNTATTTYTFEPSSGQCVTDATLTITVNPIVTPTFNAVAPICSGETLSALPTSSLEGIMGSWTPALDNTITTTYTFTPDPGECAVSQDLTITVTPNVTPTFAAVNPICAGETLTPLPTTSTNGITGTWAPALNNTTTTTYTFTPTTGQCATNQSLTIVVTPNEVPTFSTVNSICAGDTLAPLPTTSNNGIVGSWTPALDNNTTTTYTFTPNSGQCATTQTLTITVNPIVTPTFANVNPICEGENFAPLPTTSQNGIAGTWSPALDNTTTTTYTFTPNAGTCATTASLTIVVNNAGVIDPIVGDDSVCIGNTLSLTNATAGGTWSSVDPDVATVDSNGLVTPIAPGFTEIIYTTTSLCTATSLDITVYLPPNPLLTDKFICVDPVTDAYLTSVNMQCGVPNEDHTFVWTLDGQPLPTTSNLHVATEEGVYQVTVTNNITGCTASASASVNRSSTAIAEATVAQDFDQNQIITVNVTGGSGVYEYQLDNNWPQASNQFTVQQGEYTITVIDKNGCDSETLTVFALNYPRYFTPNTDGFNDTWTIEGLISQQEAQIFIFDRYGKMVKAIRPYLSEYWDGTLNGSPLPATDYWFTLNYINKEGLMKEFRSHFSLKR